MDNLGHCVFSYLCTMFVRKIRNRSGSVSVQVMNKDKSTRQNKVIKHFGTGRNVAEVERLCTIARQWADEHSKGFDLFEYDGIRHTFRDCIGADPQIADGINLHRMLVDRELRRDEEEPAFFYHSDHLGSAAYLTHQGRVIHTLNYLPYGEDWVELNFFDPQDTTRLGI